VLEIAAGTGVVTRHLASVLPESVSIVATDLNQPMLDQASEVGTKRPVEWRQADAMQLSFESGRFDAVVCQFGVMFFPEKSKAFSEARRVLRSGGVFMFNVWDRIEENDFAHTVTTALESVFPNDPPRFLARTPHGYHDFATIARDLESGGFTSSPRIDTVAARSHAASPETLRSRTARERRYATRSRHATSRGSAKRPTSRRKRLPDDSGAVLLTARYRRTLSPSNAESRQVSVSRFNLSILLPLFACAPYLPIAHGTERAGDATYWYELERHAHNVAGLEQEFLSLIAAASVEERFNLYWTYNHLTGAWLQVDFLQTLLDFSVDAPSSTDEEEIRTTLRDQAQFVLWELDHAIADLEQNVSEVKQLNYLRINEVLRSLLSEVHTTVNRLLADQCARMACAASP
jgi:spermidine synthase